MLDKLTEFARRIKLDRQNNPERTAIVEAMRSAVNWDIDAEVLLHKVAESVVPVVREYQAKALEANADLLAQLPYARPGSPGRLEYERMLAIRRGGTDAWLRGRAKQLRGQQ